MLSILAQKIHDGRFLPLIGGLLRAGYLEDWRYHATLSGCPQGGVVSPVLSDIYPDRLGQYIEQALLPAWNRGDRRAPYRPYVRLWQQACRLEQRGDREAGALLGKQMKALPSRDPAEPGHRRLRYCRYADDWLPGFTGPRHQAEEIKAEIGRFLREQLKLELSPAKTLITHGRTPAARFPGCQVVVLPAGDERDRRGHRSINAATGLKVPAGDPRQDQALHPLRQADPADRAHRRYRFQYRRAVPGRVPGRRGVLPAGVHPAPARQAEVRHGTVPGQDPGPQVPDHLWPGLPPVPCRAGHRARAPPRTAGHRAR
jgi:hypothetical protein